MFRNRLALAAVMAAAAFAPATAAQADDTDRPGKSERCEQRLERIETRFRVIEEKRGWEAASEWWQGAWERYYERCEKP